MQKPRQLTRLRQWCNARSYADKAPREPDGTLASPSDPATWSSYKECKQSKLEHLGFVVINDNDLVIIDLDDHEDDPATPEQKKLHKKIIDVFDTYTEESLSGKGAHVFVKGRIPRNILCKKLGIEMFSHGKFFISTDAIINGRPIQNRQTELDQLFEKLAATVAAPVYTDGDAVLSDSALMERACNAENAHKFNSLCNGQLNGYPSQSEADSALLAIICHYTRNNEQAKRIFRMTALGKRAKATRNDVYLDRTIAGVRGLAPPKIDLSALNAALTKEAPSKEEGVPSEKPVEEPGNDYWPPGLVGTVGRYIYRTAIRPVKEIALAASMALCAGMWGRAYNVSGTGLNQYVIVLAPTGAGKEGGPNGIDRLVFDLRKMLPTIDKERIGPGNFSSGQAILRHLEKQPCFVSVVGEFGQALEVMCDPRAHAAEKTKKRILLDLYAKSGLNSVIQPNVYSDSDKNTEAVRAPNVTILGEGTQESFYRALTQEQISDGLSPRFLVIQYEGHRVARNKAPFKRPTKKLISTLADVVERCFDLEQQNKVCNVQLSTVATTMMDDYDALCDRRINQSEAEQERMQWNRAHLKALKLAALIAVGVDHTNPIITEEIAKWSVQFIEAEIKAVLCKLTSGRYVSGNAAQEADVMAAINTYIKMSKENRLKYKPPKRTIGVKDLVPYRFVHNRVRALKSFRDDRRGEAKAIKDILHELCEADLLIKVPKETAWEKYRTNVPLFIKR